ncbi:MAG: hypothetical protein REI09_00580 [Candidatus Dactylopiibacterium sp.]|nr:hypothetical protein [Candidatus Dactylopiibacterium sp.]
MSVSVFALGSLPDIAGLRRLHGLPAALSDSEVAEFAFQRRRAEAGHDLLAPHACAFAAFAVARIDTEGRFSLQAASHAELADEAALIGACLAALAHDSAPLAWSEHEASLANLRLRALQAGLVAAPGWLRLTGGAFIGHHLAAPSDAPDLSAMARLCGLPLATGFDAGQLWRRTLAGDAGAAREDVMLRAVVTCVLALRHAVLQGECSPALQARAHTDLRAWLAHRDEPALAAFGAAWGG